jgi:hypothetical protein
MKVCVTCYLKFPTHWIVLKFLILCVMVFLKALHFDVVYSIPDVWNVCDIPMLNMKCLIAQSNLPCIMCLQLVNYWLHVQIMILHNFVCSVLWLFKIQFIMCNTSRSHVPWQFWCNPWSIYNTSKGHVDTLRFNNSSKQCVYFVHIFNCITLTTERKWGTESLHYKI